MSPQLPAFPFPDLFREVGKRKRETLTFSPIDYRANSPIDYRDHTHVLDDLGSQGGPPSHPDLLDWLAVEFRESDWDVKHLVKLLVTSATYRQSSMASPALVELDPANRLFARQARYRFDAEIIRTMRWHSAACCLRRSAAAA